VTSLSAPGLTLADRIARSRHENGGIAIWYLGQVGFLFQHRGLTVAIDPYLSYSVDRLGGFSKNFWVRNYPPPVDAFASREAEIEIAEAAVFCSTIELPGRGIALRATAHLWLAGYESMARCVVNWSKSDR